MPSSEVALITGTARGWQERAHQRDGVATLLCSRSAAQPDNALSFQVTCALKGKRPPEGYEALRKLHLAIPGAREATEQRAVIVPSSHLASHPYRPCFMQLVYPSAPGKPGALERLAALLASRVP